jgi:hypothetical protein
MSTTAATTDATTAATTTSAAKTAANMTTVTAVGPDHIIKNNNYNINISANNDSCLHCCTAVNDVFSADYTNNNNSNTSSKVFVLKSI